MRGEGRDAPGRVSPSDDDRGLAGLPYHGPHVDLPQAVGEHLAGGEDNVNRGSPDLLFFSPTCQISTGRAIRRSRYSST